MMADLIDRKALQSDVAQVCAKSHNCGPCCAVCGLIDKAPAVDAMPVSKELQAVVKRLEKEYDKAKSLKYVHDPLAFSLHRVWRKVDGERKDDEK